MEDSPNRTHDEPGDDDAGAWEPVPREKDAKEAADGAGDGQPVGWAAEEALEGPAPGEPAEEGPDDREAAATVEAILFSTDAPISPAKIAQIAALGGRRGVRQAIEALNRRYDELGCAFRIESIAGGYQMLTRPEYHDVVSRLVKARSESRLSQAALETLAIIAYRQPVLRADIEAIRGVACGEVLRGLMEKQLIKIVGRAEVLGRPMLYGTTRRFLELFGLGDLKDLPKVAELRSGAPEERKGKAAPATAAGESPGAGQGEIQVPPGSSGSDEGQAEEARSRPDDAQAVPSDPSKQPPPEAAEPPPADV